MHVVLLVWLLSTSTGNQAPVAKLLSTSQVYNWRTCQNVATSSSLNKKNKNLIYSCSYAEGGLK